MVDIAKLMCSISSVHCAGLGISSRFSRINFLFHISRKMQEMEQNRSVMK